jgi:Dolichyl-phosphate-mannose-protein mannosyltransferase
MVDRSPPVDRDRGVFSARLILVLGGLSLLTLGLAALRISSDSLSGAAVLLLGLLSSAAGATEGGWIEAALVSSARRLDVRPTQIALIPIGLGLSFAARAAAGDGPSASMPGHAWLWIASIALVVIGCWRRSGPRVGPIGWREVSGVGVIIGTAFLLRAIGLADIPYAVSGDEGGVGLVGWQYVAHLRNNLLAMGWFSFPGLHAWIVSLFQLMLGHTLLAIRLPSAFAGALGVLAVYAAGRAFYGRMVALLSSILMAGFHLHLLFSRIAVNNIWDGLWLSAVMAGLWYGWKNDNRMAFLLAGLAIGIGQYFYVTGRLLPVYAFLWILILTRQTPWRDRRSGMTCLCLAAGVVVLPLALFYLGHPDEWMAPLTRVSVFNREWVRFAGLGNIPTSALILEQLSRTVLGFAVIPLQGIYSPVSALLRPAMVVLVIAGAGMCLWRLRDPRSAMLMVGVVFPIIAGALSLDAPSSQRLLFTAPVLVIMGSLPLAAVGRRLGHERFPRVRLAALVPIAIALAVSLSDVYFFFAEAMTNGRYSDIHSLIARELADYLQTQPKGTNVYFIRPSSMGYFDIPSLTYLAPDAEGHDLLWPDDPLPALTLPNQRLVFVALPSEAPALQAIQQAYPSGETISWVLDNHQPFFSIRLAWR